MDSFEEEKVFCTGSSYKGQYNEYGMMEGYGVYKFPDGTLYEGEFKNGVFHGKGTIILPSLFKLHGNFVDGKCEEYDTEFSNGTPYQEKNWTYCKYPDRRYEICVKNKIPPVGKLNLTAQDPPRKITDGWYDTEEGFFDPVSGYIKSADNTNVLLRNVLPREREWIINNCRNTEIQPVGYQQDIIDENVLSLQELFEDEPAECECFSDYSESEEQTSISMRDSNTLIQGSRSSSNIMSNENIIVKLADKVRGVCTKIHSALVEDEEPLQYTDSTFSEPSVPTNESVTLNTSSKAEGSQDYKSVEEHSKHISV